MIGLFINVIMLLLVIIIVLCILKHSTGILVSILIGGIVYLLIYLMWAFGVGNFFSLIGALFN